MNEERTGNISVVIFTADIIFSRVAISFYVGERRAYGQAGVCQPIFVNAIVLLVFGLST